MPPNFLTGGWVFKLEKSEMIRIKFPEHWAAIIYFFFSFFQFRFLMLRVNFKMLGISYHIWTPLKFQTHNCIKNHNKIINYKGVASKSKTSFNHLQGGYQYYDTNRLVC